MNRALPGQYVDLIREGVQVSTRSRGDIEVYNALVRTAMSATQRGWSFAEWSALVREDGSDLGRQLGRRGGDGRNRSAEAIRRSLRKAWTTAERQTALSPPTTPEDARQAAAEVEAFAANPDANLPDVWRAILAHAGTVAHTNSTIRPALPRHQIVAATGYGDRTIRTALAKMDAAGLLRVAVRGRAGIPRSSVSEGASQPPSHLLSRATLYRLPSAAVMAAHLCPETGQVGPLAHTSRTPAFLAHLDPPHTSRTPAPKEAPAVVTLTVTASNLVEVLEAVRLAVRLTGAEVSVDASTDQSDHPLAEVVVLRPADRQSA